MPRNKDLKRLVRTRMRKTGEACTAGLAHIARLPSQSRLRTTTVIPHRPHAKHPLSSPPSTRRSPG